MLRTLLVLLALASAITVACSDAGGSANGDSTAGSAATREGSGQAGGAGESDEARPRFGVAGLIPRNYPDSTADDWVAMYEGLGATGELLGAYGNWSDPTIARGELPLLFETTFGLQDRYDYTPLLVIGFASDDPAGGGITPQIDWADPADREAFERLVVGIAESEQPPVLLLGNEVNRIWQDRPDHFDAFAAAYPALYDAVKAVSPGTQVGTVFQLETLKGDAFLSGGSGARQPQWDLLDRFAGHLDVLGLTTYPYFDFQDPAAIPADYYAEAATRAGVPIGLTEIGWPSQPLSTAPESGYGGSPEEQAAFVTRFFELIDDVDVAFALWSFQHDIGPLAGPAFESVSLREHDGAPKPAFEVWSRIAAR